MRRSSRIMRRTSGTFTGIFGNTDQDFLISMRQGVDKQFEALQQLLKRLSEHPDTIFSEELISTLIESGLSSEDGDVRRMSFSVMGCIYNTRGSVHWNEVRVALKSEIESPEYHGSLNAAFDVLDALDDSEIITLAISKDFCSIFKSATMHPTHSLRSLLVQRIGLLYLKCWLLLDDIEVDGFIFSESIAESRRMVDDFCEIIVQAFKSFALGAIGKAPGEEVPQILDDSLVASVGYCKVLTVLLQVYNKGFDKVRPWTEALLQLNDAEFGFISCEETLAARLRVSVRALPLVRPILVTLFTDFHLLIARYIQCPGNQLSLAFLINNCITAVIQDISPGNPWIRSVEVPQVNVMFGGNEQSTDETKLSRAGGARTLVNIVDVCSEEWLLGCALHTLHTLDIPDIVTFLRDFIIISQHENMAIHRSKMCHAVLINIFRVLRAHLRFDSLSNRNNTAADQPQNTGEAAAALEQLAAWWLLCARHVTSATLASTAVGYYRMVVGMPGMSQCAVTRVITEFIALLLTDPQLGSGCVRHMSVFGDFLADVHIESLLRDSICSVRLITAACRCLTRMLGSAMTTLLTQCNLCLNNKKSNAVTPLAQSCEQLMLLCHNITAALKSFARCMSWSLDGWNGESAQLAYHDLLRTYSDVLLPGSVSVTALKTQQQAQGYLGILRSSKVACVRQLCEQLLVKQAELVTFLTCSSSRTSFVDVALSSSCSSTTRQLLIHLYIGHISALQPTASGPVLDRLVAALANDLLATDETKKSVEHQVVFAVPLGRMMGGGGVTADLSPLDENHRKKQLFALEALTHLCRIVMMTSSGDETVLLKVLEVVIAFRQTSCNWANRESQSIVHSSVQLLEGVELALRQLHALSPTNQKLSTDDQNMTEANNNFNITNLTAQHYSQTSQVAHDSSKQLINARNGPADLSCSAASVDAISQFSLFSSTPDIALLGQRRLCSADVMALVDDVIDSHWLIPNPHASLSDEMKKHKNNKSHSLSDTLTTKANDDDVSNDLINVLMPSYENQWQCVSGSSDLLTVLQCCAVDRLSGAVTVFVRVINSSGFKIPGFEIQMLVSSGEVRTVNNDINSNSSLACRVTEASRGAVQMTKGSPYVACYPFGDSMFLPDAVVDKQFVFVMTSLRAVDVRIRVRYADICAPQEAVDGLVVPYSVLYGSQPIKRRPSAMMSSSLSSPSATANETTDMGGDENTRGGRYGARATNNNTSNNNSNNSKFVSYNAIDCVPYHISCSALLQCYGLGALSAMSQLFNCQLPVMGHGAAVVNTTCNKSPSTTSSSDLLEGEMSDDRRNYPVGVPNLVFQAQWGRLSHWSNVRVECCDYFVTEDSDGVSGAGNPPSLATRRNCVLPTALMTRMAAWRSKCGQIGDQTLSNLSRVLTADRQELPNHSHNDSQTQCLAAWSCQTIWGAEVGLRLCLEKIACTSSSSPSCTSSLASSSSSSQSSWLMWSGELQIRCGSAQDLTAIMCDDLQLFVQHVTAGVVCLSACEPPTESVLPCHSNSSCSSSNMRSTSEGAGQAHVISDKKLSDVEDIVNTLALMCF